MLEYLQDVALIMVKDSAFSIFQVNLSAESQYLMQSSPKHASLSLVLNQKCHLLLSFESLLDVELQPYVQQYLCSFNLFFFGDLGPIFYHVYLSLTSKPFPH